METTCEGVKEDGSEVPILEKESRSGDTWEKRTQDSPLPLKYICSSHKEPGTGNGYPKESFH